MGRLLGITHRTSDGADDPRVLDLDSPAGEAAIDALSSETARKLLSELYDGPATPPELRDEVGTSLQNVHYHLDQLAEADLVREGGVTFSEKGTEMTVYEPTGEALLVVAGEQSVRDRIRTLVTRVLGGVAAIAIATLAFAGGLRLFDRRPGSAGRGDQIGAESADRATETVRMMAEAQTTAVDAPTQEAAGQATIDPVFAFALGATVILLAVGVGWAIRASDVEIRT